MLAMFLFMRYYMSVTLHYSALKTGVAYLPLSGGVIVAAEPHLRASRAVPSPRASRAERRPRPPKLESSVDHRPWRIQVRGGKPSADSAVLPVPEG